MSVNMRESMAPLQGKEKTQCRFVETINEMKIEQFRARLRNNNIISYWGLALF